MWKCSSAVWISPCPLRYKVGGPCADTTRPAQVQTQTFHETQTDTGGIVEYDYIENMSPRRADHMSSHGTVLAFEVYSQTLAEQIGQILRIILIGYCRI